jgi:hypothetical protein
MRLIPIIVVPVAMAAAATAVQAEDTLSGALGVARIAVLEAQLHRGVSTRADVERLLGPPSGSGGAELPGDSIRRGIWCYGNIEVIHRRTGTWDQPVIVATNAQRTLLIFFDGDIYSGFVWISYPAAPGY